MNTNKNKGTSFEDYLKLVVAALMVAGFSSEDSYPDEDEVRMDYDLGKTVEECANEFIENWTVPSPDTSVDDLLDNILNEEDENI